MSVLHAFSSGGAAIHFPRLCSGRGASRQPDRCKRPARPRIGRLLAEAPRRLCVGRHRLWHSDCNAGLLTGKDAFTVEVTAVGDDIEARRLKRHFRLLGHMRELRPVGSDVSYLVRDDQMMLGVDDNLRVVTHDTGDSSTRRHRAGIRIGERYLLIWSSQHLRLATFKTVHLLPSNY